MADIRLNTRDRDFLQKGCQVVKTPMYTGFATSKRLSEVVIRLSSSRDWGFYGIRMTFQQKVPPFAQIL